MPAFALPDDQIWELAAFVRSLNAPAISVPVPGDAAAGEAIFFGKQGCSGCHMILGKGGYLGPDLSSIGEARRLNEIREAIVNPKAEATAGYRPVLVDVSKRERLRGVARHESNWSLQVLDETGKPASAARRRDGEGEVSEPVVDAGRASDGAKRLQNVLAYLSRRTVRGGAN